MKLATGTGPTTRALIGLVAGLAFVIVGVQTAFSKPALASPTITSKPAAATSSTSATFAFTGPKSATLSCSLDAAAYAPCTSPKSYSGLSQGSHTFRVVSVKGTEQSAPTSYTWLVDATAPTAPTLTAKPAALSNDTAPTFAFSGSEPGLTFRCALDGAAAASCTSPKTFSGVEAGDHSFRVTAVDAAGNEGPATSWSWNVDTTAPHAPALTLKPTDPTYNATNFFEWTGSEGGLTYQCSLENGAWATCGTPYTWVIETSNYGLHQFAVRAVDVAGNVSMPAAYTFKYEKKLPDSGVPFGITGSVGSLIIGEWRPVPVTITNPNSVTIFVSALDVAVSADSTPSGCLSGPNIELEQSDVSETHLLPVEAGQTVTLPAEGISAPRMRLRNLPTVNQDICKNKTFDLTFSGTATN